jgi:hypothetical protein
MKKARTVMRSIATCSVASDKSSREEQKLGWKKKGRK